MEERSGTIEVTGGRVWYRRIGQGAGCPLLVLHGGPGAASYYVEPFAERMAVGRPVVVYDQLGCGRSETPDDPSLWTLDRCCTELDDVRRQLGLERCHLFGQSWGGWLSIEYLSRGTEGVGSVVLASTSASMPEFVAAAHRIIEALPDPWRGTLLRLGELEAYDDPDYQEAVMEFYRRHLCRLDPWPECVVKSMDQLPNQIYLTMNGPTEFDVVGPLRTWDRTADLGRVSMAHAGDRGTVRRDHAVVRPDHRRRGRRRAARGLRGVRSHGSRGGAGALRGGRGWVSGRGRRRDEPSRCWAHWRLASASLSSVSGGSWRTFASGRLRLRLQSDRRMRSLPPSGRTAWACLPQASA